MSTEHKGPLAAFIVVAVIAGILLVTSVRSQAATGWLVDQLPTAAVVAAAPGAATDGLIAALGSVDPGAVLVPKAAADTPPAPQQPAQASPSSQPSQSTATVTHTATTHASTTHHTTTHQVTTTTHQLAPTHGHHSGHIGVVPPAHHHGWEAPGQGHGQGHGHGQSHVHDHGPSHGHGHAHSHGHDHGRHLGWDKQHTHGAFRD